MSCDAIAATVYLWLAASGGSGHALPAATAAVAMPMTVADEPLFADIVHRAGALKAEVDAFLASAKPIPTTFRTRIGELSALDMQGHVLLKERGTDGDLKCILRGISQDLPLKLAALEGAADATARALALKEMGYLLRDNVEVITAPPAPPV